jgi:Iodothyronine deiodinase
VSLGQLFKKYQDKVQFVMVYLREAHPVDGWTFGHGIMARMVNSYAPHTNIVIQDPQTIDERRQVAASCQEKLQYGFKTYVDEMDDRVNTLYAAQPTRLYLIGLDGKVVYASGAGALGFKPAKFGDGIKSYLKEQ